MRFQTFKWFVFGAGMAAAAIGIFLLILLNLFSGTVAVFFAWLLGSLLTTGIGYGIIRRRYPQGTGEPMQPNADPQAQGFSPRLTQAFTEITASADLIGDIAGSTEAVLFQNEQAMRPIATAVEKIASGAAEQTQFTQETVHMAEELAATTASLASGARAQGASIAHADQLNQHVLEIVAAANQVAATAQQAGSQTAADMDSIRSSVSMATEKAQAMNKRSNDIRLVL